MPEEKQEDVPFNESVNIWQSMLEDCKVSTNNAQGGFIPSTLVLLGDSRSGKSQLLKQFQNLVTIPETPEYLLDYAYINVKNKYIQDKNEIQSRLGVWSLDDPAHSDLVVKLCGPLSHTAYAICVDLSNPSEALTSLQKWLRVLEEINAKLLNRLALDQQLDLKRKISRHLQFFVDPSKPPEIVPKTAEGVDAGAPPGDVPASAVEGAEGDVEIDMAVPKINFGVPLFIVGTKADYFSRMPTGTDKKFEYLSQQLRKVCLDYGAALVFTSAAGDGVNIGVLQDYCYHRVFEFPLKEGPKSIGSAKDFGLFVPSGYDSSALIESAAGAYPDGTSLDKVFDATGDASQNPQAEQETVALEAEAFLQQLKDQLAAGPSKTSLGPNAASAEITAFFTNLLAGKKE